MDCIDYGDGYAQHLQSLGATRDEYGAPIIASSAIGRSPGASTIATWFEVLTGLARMPASDPEYLSTAAELLLVPGGLDAGWVLSHQDGHWHVVRAAAGELDDELRPRLDVLRRAAREQATLYCGNSSRQQLADDVEAVICAPVLDAQQNVSGAFYGARVIGGVNARKSVRPLECLWVQLLAEQVAAAELRRAAEADCARHRVMLQQIFAPEIVSLLERDPGLLSSQTRTATILFMDLWRSTAIAEQLGVELTHEFLSHLMDCMTEHVMRHGGVMIDYFGDGLSAMWNAPTDQPDHALRACRAAAGMQAEIPTFNSEWEELAGVTIRIGIGIHTGTVSVGNSGSRWHMKYGPRGQVVSAASRIERATRQSGEAILISDATRTMLPANVTCEYIERAQLSGIQDPVDLYGVRQVDEMKLARSPLAEFRNVPLTTTRPN
ncbi:MAG: adenylate/guanylate cyclase domain-containing protein [Planctomycetales bacterium]|nr:adenylate/guanylate cyclase domain-containing protein [Planctomycetales bacterium]